MMRFSLCLGRWRAKNVDVAEVVCVVFKNTLTSLTAGRFFISFSMRILKFGGSSVGTPEAMQKVMQIVTDAQQKDQKVAVVVSAFQGVTDQLIAMANDAARGDPAYKFLLGKLSDRHLAAVRSLITVKNQSSVLASVIILLRALEDLFNGIFFVREISPRTLDAVMSFGERLSAFILTEAFKDRGQAAEFFDARIVVKTDDAFTAAHVLFDQTAHNIQSYFQDHSALQIITGFIGSTMDGTTTTLGRGGSDYTASIFGAALDAEMIEIWTDVDGVLTADPRVVKNAFSLSAITYEEAMEMAHFGAKVIYPPTMQPARAKKIPLLIKNTFNPSHPGTVIHTEQDNVLLPCLITTVPKGHNADTANVHDFLITGISSIHAIALLRIEGSGMIGISGIAARVFHALSQQKISVILITQASSEQSICLAIEPHAGQRARTVLEQEFAFEIHTQQVDRIIVEEGLSCIAIVGENMRHMPGISGRLFAALGKNGVNVVAIAQGSSELNVSVIIAQKDEAKALNAVHDTFFFSYSRPLHVFLVGTGLIGSTLCAQIKAQAAVLRKDHFIDVRLCAVANSQKMVFANEGQSLVFDKADLLAHGVPLNLDAFIEKMHSMNLPNSVFVDCTASDQVPAFYEEILNASISIVTPNKKGNSGAYERYRVCKNTAKRRAVKFFYETTVGAGLPVINTLQSLLLSGDMIVRIEGVLSGTLSYLFNTFDGTTPFSSLVAEARRLGYTEPDPRDDLCGMDVARKLLILAREMGFRSELQDIVVENLVPEDCRNAVSVEAFLAQFSKADPVFASRHAQAAAAGKKLRYIASFYDGKASVSLQAVDQTHPFYSLSGGENIIAFTTKRYQTHPLVVRGPGAGPAVTAGGVFADILHVAHYLF